MFVVKTDGSFVGPPVSVGIGAFVVLQNGRRIHEEAARDERVTSSTVAEALAIVKALLWLESKGYHKDAVVVATDSRSTLDVVRGKVAKTRSKMLDEFCDWIKAASRNFADLVFLNCHRAEVSEAQQLARIALRPERRAIKEGTEVIPEPPALPPTPAIHVPTTAAAVEAEPRKGRRRGRRGGRGRRKTTATAAPVAVPAAPKPVKPVAAPPPPPPKPAPKAGRPEPVKAPALNFLQQAILKRRK
jgi:ribonuclease HI